MASPLTAKEKKEMRRLQDKWARRTASSAEMERCRELERQHSAAVKEDIRAVLVSQGERL